MKFQRFFILFSVIMTAFLTTSLPAKEPHVLFFGIDGLRADTLSNAKTPAMDGLIAEGVLIPKAQALGSYKGAGTVSGPSWSSILTGVWANKHGVHNNSFEGRNFEQFPHFFTLLKQTRPEMQTVSFVGWEPLQTFLVSDEDIGKYIPLPPYEKTKETNDERFARGIARDRILAEDAAKILGKNDPAVMFVYFHQVDFAGHRFGFSPDIPEYIQAVENVDKAIEIVLKALKARPRFQDEDWLIVVTSDHGGEGKTHAKGHNNPAMLDIPMIFSGSSTESGAVIETPVYSVDIVPTILTHLGIAIDPAWQLDGQVLKLDAAVASP